MLPLAAFVQVDFESGVALARRSACAASARQRRHKRETGAASRGIDARSATRAGSCGTSDHTCTVRAAMAAAERSRCWCCAGPQQAAECLSLPQLFLCCCHRSRCQRRRRLPLVQSTIAAAADGAHVRVVWLLVRPLCGRSAHAICRPTLICFQCSASIASASCAFPSGLPTHILSTGPEPLFDSTQLYAASERLDRDGCKPSQPSRTSAEPGRPLRRPRQCDFLAPVPRVASRCSGSGICQTTP